MKHRYTVVWLMIFLSGIARGQSIEEGYYRAPLDIPLYLAGNFAEMRSNHFHSGLDFKTQGREGLNLYSVADGYVSRIKVSPYGYGNALYIDHPNGTTSVYAHLQSYNDSITAFLRKAQYDLESFEVDLYPEKSQLPVKQGDIIGLSGNTGSSGGPHLHFEIRETATEFPLNPLALGFDVKDYVKPEILNLMIIPALTDNAWDESNADTYPCHVTRGNCRLARTSPIKVPQKVGFAIHTLDRLNDQPNKCGVYTIKLYVDSNMVFHQQMDKLNFDTKSHMNAHTVYGVFKQERKSFHRSFCLPNNRLELYPTSCSGMELTPGQHHCRYEVTDVHGNLSSLEFDIDVDPKLDQPVYQPKGQWFVYDTVNAFRSEHCSVFIPEGRLFQDFDFMYEMKDTLSGTVAPLHVIGDPWEPVANSYILKIELSDVPETLRDKVLVTRYDPDRKRHYNEGGNWKHGWIECRPKTFGQFTVMIDSLPPVVRAQDFRANMKDFRDFSFKIQDDLSGIAGYRATIDDQWILMEYHPRRARITYTFDEQRFKKGDHRFELEVWDERGNTTTYSKEFTW